MEGVCLSLKDAAKEESIKEIIKGFVIDEDKALRLKSVFEQELEQGMKDGLKGSSLQMENTFVPELMNGEEEGLFLALDLGGTNFRVILLEMAIGRITREIVKYYFVEETTRLGPGKILFDFLAQCIQDFITDQHLDGDHIETLPLGFTFSFPVTQQGLDSGILVTWTKSFNCPGVVGEDAAKMLNDALKRQGNKKVKVVAILNDTTGTLVKGAYDDPNTCIGLILGTGTNGAYFERSSNVIRWGTHLDHNSPNVIIDPEFGAFGDNGCIDFLKTPFDAQVDEESLLPGSFTYEKHFAGKFIGDIFHHVLIHLHRKGLAFKEAKELKRIFNASHVSSIVQDFADNTNQRTNNILTQVTGQEDIDEDDIAVVQELAKILSERCAIMVAIPLAVFLERIGRGPLESSAIAVTGSLYQHHPTIKPSLERYIKAFSKNKSNIYTFLSEDGSGKGAGLVAAIAARLTKF